MPKVHELFRTFSKHCHVVHLAHSEGWKDVLIELIGAIWECWIAVRYVNPVMAGILREFWNTYLVAPWSNWTVGELMHVPCLIPSNQMVEAFFRNVVRTLGGRGNLRGSASTVLQKMLPRIMNHQDMHLPDNLCFEVCDTHLYST